jgi:hypothetical protein
MVNGVFKLFFAFLGNTGIHGKSKVTGNFKPIVTVVTWEGLFCEVSLYTRLWRLYSLPVKICLRTRGWFRDPHSPVNGIGHGDRLMGDSPGGAHQSFGTWPSLNKKRVSCCLKQSRTVWPPHFYRIRILHFTLPLPVRIRIKRCSTDIQQSLRLYEGETHGNVRKKDCRYQC